MLTRMMSCTYIYVSKYSLVVIPKTLEIKWSLKNCPKPSRNSHIEGGKVYTKIISMCVIGAYVKSFRVCSDSKNENVT